MPKFKQQSFEIIAQKYNLKKVFDVFDIQSEDYEIDRPQMICGHCKHQITNKCNCEVPDFKDGHCQNIKNCEYTCGGIQGDVCQCEYGTRIQPPYKYISIYDSCDQYGGPEEGGWWYTSSYLQQSYECESEEQASQIREEMRQLAEELNKEQHNAHNRHLADSLDWLEARGLDADFLPEPDGPNEFWITTEWFPGENHSGNYRPHYC